MTTIPKQPRTTRPKPRRLRPSRRFQLDALFWRIVAISALGHIGLVVHAMALPAPQQPSLETIPDVFVRTVLRSRPEPVEPTVALLPPPRHSRAPRPANDLEPPQRSPVPSEAQLSLDRDRAHDNPAEGHMSILRSRLNQPVAMAMLDPFPGGSSQPPRFQDARRPTPDRYRPGEGEPELRDGSAGDQKLSHSQVGSIGKNLEVAISPPTLRIPPPLVSAPEVTGGLNKQALDQSLRAYLGAVTTCYEQALKLNPALHGKFYLDFTVEASGSVSHIVIRSSRGTSDETLTGCLQGRVARWRFPVSDDGATDVTLPILFTATTAL